MEATAEQRAGPDSLRLQVSADVRAGGISLYPDRLSGLLSTTPSLLKLPSPSGVSWQWPCSLTASLQALAGPAYDFTSVNLYGNSYGITQTVGFLFTPTTDIRVTSLGFFDYLGDGLGESHQLGIFDATGNLLVSAFLPSGTASPLENGFRYVDIVPLALAAGQDYTMAAFLATQADVVGYLNIADLVVDPVVGLSSVPARYIVPSGTELMFPTQTALLFTSFFLGPNFKLSATESIPLPGTLVRVGPMLGVLLVVGRRQSAKRDPI